VLARFAQRLLGEVAKGNDPAADKQSRRKAVTVAELCDQYLKDATAGRVLKRSGYAKRTLAIDTGRIERHIKPLLGSYAVAGVTRRDASVSCTTLPQARRRPASKPNPAGLRG
jgi:hypothetical protein